MCSFLARRSVQGGCVLGLDGLPTSREFVDHRGASVGAGTGATPILLGPPAPARRARKRIVAITHHHRATKWNMAVLARGHWAVLSWPSARVSLPRLRPAC